MIIVRRREPPGPCPICGAPHSACTRYSGPVVIAQLPARDAAAGVPLHTAAPVPAPEPAPPRLPGGAFTTGSYRRSQHGRRAR
jgi:hypothetical protein